MRIVAYKPQCRWNCERYSSFLGYPQHSGLVRPEASILFSYPYSSIGDSQLRYLVCAQTTPRELPAHRRVWLRQLVALSLAPPPVQRPRTDFMAVFLSGLLLPGAGADRQPPDSAP